MLFGGKKDMVTKIIPFLFFQSALKLLCSKALKALIIE